MGIVVAFDNEGRIVIPPSLREEFNQNYLEIEIDKTLMDVNDAHHKTAIISMDKVYDRISGIERTDPRSIQGHLVRTNESQN